MHQCVCINRKKAHSTKSGYIKTAEEIKKYSIIKITPEKSVAYFYIQLFNVSQKEKKLRSKQMGMWTITSTEQTKAISQRYTIWTHAGLRLQSNKDLAPCMLACQLLEIPRQKWGDMEQSFHHPHPKQGRTEVRSILVHTKCISHCNTNNHSSLYTKND